MISFAGSGSLACMGGPGANPAEAVEAMASRLPLLSLAAEAGLLEQAGFERHELFYAAFTFKGWVAYADL